MGRSNRVALAWSELGHDVSAPAVSALIERGAYPIAGADDGAAGGESPPGPGPSVGAGVATAGQQAEPQQNGDGGLGAVGERMDQILERMGSLEQRIPAPEQPQFDPNDPLAGMQYGDGQGMPQLSPEQLAAQQGQPQLDPQQLAAMQQQQYGAQQPQFDQFGNPLQPGMAPGQLPPELGGQPGMGLGEDFFQQQVQQATQQAIAPLMQQQQQLAQQVEAGRRETEAAGLLEDYPELKEPDAAKHVVEEAQQWAQDLGNPALAGEPGFVELVHLAAKTVERGRSENPAGGEGTGEGSNRPVSLEQPGGTPAAAAGGEPTEAEKIKGAVQRHPIFG